MRYAVLALLAPLALAGCRPSAVDVQQLEANYLAASSQYQHRCQTMDATGASSMLTGQPPSAAELEKQRAAIAKQEQVCPALLADLKGAYQKLQAAQIAQQSR